MTFEQIIDVANSRTDNRGKKLQLNWELYTVIQDLCSRHRWYWRRKRYTFNTAQGTETYDLTDSSVIASSGGLDVEEIIKNSVFLVNGATKSQLGVLFDEDLQQSAILNAATQDVPEAVFIEPGTSQTLRVTPTPNGAYPIYFFAWAMPNGDYDGATGAIPLIPKYMHPILVKGLEAQINRYTIGEGSAKYMAASAEYESGIAKFIGRAGISGESRNFINEDFNDAVQST
mgnify:CR=1 FL=1